MGPSTICPERRLECAFESDTQPPTKRQKVDSPSSRSFSAIPPHPLRIKPFGNAFTSSINLRDTSTGLFALLPDELIIQILGFLDASSLLAIGATSKGFYAFSQFEELWKDLFIFSYASRPTFTWQRTWRSTFLSKTPNATPIPCPNLYSDVLYRPFYCSQLPFHEYASPIPTSNLIPRLPDLSVSEFNEKWANKPFILTSPVKTWLGYDTWTLPYLLARYGNIEFRAEAVDWPLKTYYEYMQNNTDESPLYLFDKLFAEKTEMGKEYNVPQVFKQDFFDVLEGDRPDRKWMILGPARSGSSWHKDPNATSAWNAVAWGKKYWIMFPKDVTPPGVIVSEDMSEVTSPLSIAEWFEGFHREARKLKGVKEGICRRGEVLYVPSGWWHLVVNLSPSLAITQNFVPRKHLPSALLFLRDQPQSVSGFDCAKVPDPYNLFVERLREKHPDILEEALREVGDIAAGKGRRGGKWNELVEAARNNREGFMFNFCEDEDSGRREENEGDCESPYRLLK